MHEQGLGMKKDWHLAKRMYDLAAETNVDAKIPVALALFKLQTIMQVEAIRESPFRFILYMDENIIANWDLYLITILTLFLGFIMYIKRNQEAPANPPGNTPTEGTERQENNATEEAATATPPPPPPQNHPADVPM